MRCRTLLGVHIFAALLALISFGANATEMLFTIGPDASPFFVPRTLNELPSTSPVSASFLADLGDGSVGFNGGLAYDTADGQLYTIGNDSSGLSTLYSMTTLGGTLTAIGGGLGVGFNGGLAYDSLNDTFYAIANDFLGNSTLYEVSGAGVATPLGAIGVGFYGGLTFNANDGNLYAIAGDAFGAMRNVVAIDAATVAANPLFDLGDGSVGFNGGLTYDVGADLFYVIGNDFLADSTLFSFTLAGSSTPGDDLAPIGSSFGQGFLNAGLALAPEVTPPPPPSTVDEPSTLSLMLFVLLLGPLIKYLNERYGAPSRLRSAA